MDLLIVIAVVVTSLALPIKCYQDGEYKKACLQMRGTLETKGGIDNCVVPPEPPKAKEVVGG
jgi:hypothetical protein